MTRKKPIEKKGKQFDKLKVIKEPTYAPVTELTPELSEKLYTQIMQKIHDQQVAKDHVLGHLKQLKAQIGKYINKHRGNHEARIVVHDMMEILNKKIAKINGVKEQKAGKSKQ